MEHAIMLFIQEHLRTEGLTGFFRVATTFGDYGIFWISICLLLLAAAGIMQVQCRKNGKTNLFMRPALVNLVSMALCFLIANLLLKNLVARPRPYQTFPDLTTLTRRPRDYSFPSGHTAIGFASAAALFWSVPKKQRWIAVVLLILSVLVALSRVYLGVHYPTDVLAGTVIGVLTGKIASVVIAEKNK